MFHGQVTGADMWRVQLATGEVRMVTLDGLDDAFQQGLIDENTFVLAPGAMAWAKLGDAAGLDAPDAQPEQTPSILPLAIDMDYGTPPGALDLDLDMSDEAFKRSGKGKFFAVAGVLVAVLGLGVFGATKLGTIGTVAAVKNEASLAVAPPPAVTDLGPKAASVASLPNAAPNESARPALSDGMKQKLADADKARDAKTKSKAVEKAAKAPKSSGKREKGKAPFVSGGDKFDPLNGAL